MKKIVPFFVVLVFLVSCKKELVKTPTHLIEKEKMVNIMYDISLIDAMKIQSQTTLDSFNFNTSKYILKKYKVDSLQFAQNNIYYAADYKEYTKMMEQVKARLDQNKSQVETLIKNKKKKDSISESANKKIKLKKESDSVKKAKQAQKFKKLADSIKKVKEIEAAKSADSLKKAKKKK